MLVESARAASRRGLSGDAWLGAMYEMGNRSALLVCAGMSCFGVVMVTIANVQARRFVGNLTLVGPAYFEMLIRDLGPLTVAVLASARSGAKDASELASMSVNDQVEALEMSAGDPLSDLVAPRVLAGVVAFPVLCVLGTAAAGLSAAGAAQFIFQVDGSSFLDPRYVDAGDLAAGFLKALLSGAYVPLAASWRGLGARGGSMAVGLATTDGVVASVLGVLMIDLLISVAFRIAGA
jgi:phospholipid/cholesterol/gamma-HCH transport system permease protein